MAEMAAAAWAFIKAAFVAVGSGTATAGQVATVVAVNVAGSVALSAATSVLMKPDVGGRAPGEWLADPNAGIPFAIGDRIGVAGNIVYKNTFGKDNEYKGIVTVLSGAGPISAYLGFTADREPVAFAGEAATGRYGGEMWMQRRLGEQPDTALTSPAAITYQTLPNWGPNHRLSGKAAFMWTLRMDSKFSVYPQGEPAPITLLRGIKGYDHRYDSTMPGGSGPCRLNDRSSYRTITNPAIADLNWCLGLRENGKVVGGLGVSPAGIDWSAYTRAANVADANAWTLAAYPRSDESKSEVRAGMLQAAGAVISRRAGLVSCVTRGAPKSPVMTISAADTAGPIELDTAANVLNRYNTMTARYLSEAHEWMLTPAAPVSSSVYVEEDRGRVRSDQRDYPYVSSAKQAAELCALDIAHSREGIAGRWPLKAYCRELEPGDVFTVDEPGLLLDGMDMLVLDRDYDPETDTPYVVFVSETAGKVAWALGQQANPSPTPALSARHDLNAPHPDAWDVVIVPPSPEGVSTPGAEVVIDIDNVRAEDLVVEIGPSAAGPWRVVKTVTIVDGQLRIPVNELSPGEVFWVALSYRSADDGPSPKTIKGPFTAGDLVSNDTAHLKGEPVQDILDKLTGAAELAEQNRQAVAELEEVYGDTASAAASAAAAALERAAAEAAAALSANKAEDAAASAVAASTAAGDALGSASASAASASVASTKADEASVSAAASTAAKTAAETARGQAQTAATNAASSRDDAAGSAASASASAQQSANSRDAAAGSASAAAGSASTATTKAGEAGVSAAAAAASQVSASTAAKGASDQAAGLLYSAFDKPDTWTQVTSTGGSTEGLLTTSYSVVNDPDLGLCLEVDIPADTAIISHKGAVYGVGKTHRLRLKAKCVTPGPGNGPDFSDARLDASLGYLTRGQMAQPAASAGQIVDYDQVVPTGQRLNNTAGAEYVRFGFRCSGVWRLSMFSVDDETESAAAKASATAAATSASSASASETAAGQSATAASGSATTAATRAGEALTYRNQASTSAADAQAASVSAGVSATSARLASNQTMPTRLAERENFCGAISGRPETINAFAFGTVVTDPAEGDVLRLDSVYNIQNRGWRKIEPGRSFRTTVRSKVVSNGSDTNRPQYGFRLLSSDGTSLVVTAGIATQVAADGWVEFSLERTAEQLWSLRSDAVYVRGFTRANRNDSNAASGAVTDMAFLRFEDVTESASASNSAAAAITQAANASASAAEARFNANLAAQIGGGSMNQNPTFAAWSGTAAVGPDQWVRYNSASGTIDKVAGRNGQPNSARTISNGTANFGLYQAPVVSASGGEWLVVEASFTLVAGDLRGSGLTVQARTGETQVGANLNLNFATVADVGGRVNGAGAVGKVYTYRGLIDARTGAGVDNYRVYMMTRLSTFSPQGAVTLDWHEAAIRPATPEEVASGTVLPEVEGRLAIVAEVAADAAEQIGSARFRVTGDGGAEPFDISLEAGPDGSAASLTAKAIRLRNIVNGQAINVVEVVGGKARFSGDVQIDGNLVLDGTLNGRRVMVPDTVTPMAATYAAGSIGLNGTTATQVQEVWVTTQGGPVVVEFNGLINMRHDPSGSFDAVMEVRRSPNTGTGVQMLYMSVPALGGGNDSVLGMYPLKLIDRPAAGTWRYFVTVWSTTSNMTIQEVRQRFMSALEYRTNS